MCHLKNGLLSQDPLRVNLFYSELESFDIGGPVKGLDHVLDCDLSCESSTWVSKYEPLTPLASCSLPPSIESKLELKALPNTLKYVFLGSYQR